MAIVSPNHNLPWMCLSDRFQFGICRSRDIFFDLHLCHICHDFPLLVYRWWSIGRIPGHFLFCKRTDSLGIHFRRQNNFRIDWLKDCERTPVHRLPISPCHDIRVHRYSSAKAYGPEPIEWEASRRYARRSTHLIAVWQISFVLQPTILQATSGCNFSWNRLESSAWWSWKRWRLTEAFKAGSLLSYEF